MLSVHVVIILSFCIFCVSFLFFFDNLGNFKEFDNFKKIAFGFIDFSLFFCFQLSKSLLFYFILKFFLVLPLYCYQPISLHPCAHMLSHVTPWTAAHQAPLSMDFSRQEYWRGLPLPSPGFCSFNISFLLLDLCLSLLFL